MPKWLPLMKTGTFRDRHGKDYTITDATLTNIVDNYSSDQPAHIVVGHPNKKNGVPSFGLVDKLKKVKNELQWLPRHIVPEFAALVKKGGFPDVSAGLNSALTELNHIAFLSSEQPAITGLTPIAEFSGPECDTDVVMLDLPENSLTDMAEFASDSWIGWRLQTIARVLRNLRDNIIEKQDVETADKIIPNYTIDELSNDPPTERSLANPQFSQTERGDSMDYKVLYEAEQEKVNVLTNNVAEFSQKVTELTDANVKLLDANNSLSDKNDKAEFGAYVETLIADKKILPDQKETTVNELVAMKKATPAEFSSDDGSKSPLDIFKAQLEKLPVLKIPDDKHTARSPEFSADDYDPIDVGNKAANYRRAQEKLGVDVSLDDAISHVTQNSN